MFTVKANQKGCASGSPRRPGRRCRPNTRHERTRNGRTTTWQATVQPAQAWIEFPHTAQTIRLTRDRVDHHWAGEQGTRLRDHVVARFRRIRSGTSGTDRWTLGRREPAPLGSWGLVLVSFEARIVGVALPMKGLPTPNEGTTEMKTATQRIADFVAGFELKSAPDEVVEKAKVTLTHDLGVALAGYRLSGPAYELAGDIGRCAEGGARLPVTGTRVTLEQAALATGALMHARTQDDTQMTALTHLGCTVLPALLALGDRDDASGQNFLTAMIAGYEATSAAAEEHSAASTQRGLRATSIYGPLGSAAACSRLLNLNVEQTVNALGLAVAFGGGTNQTWVAGTQEWQYQVGSASRNGMIAALLAERGVSGAPDALEGVAGHYAAFAGTRERAERVATDLGQNWRILAVTYKPYPICAINQVPVTVTVGLAARHDIREQDVESMVLKLSPGEAAYPGTDSHGPFTDVGGSLMSAPYCLAVAIRKRTIQFDDLRSFDDEALMDLARRVEVVPDPQLPANSCRLAVRTSRGEFQEEYISTPQTFNWDRIETAERLRSIVNEMPFGEDRLEEFVKAALDVENKSVRDLVTTTIA